MLAAILLVQSPPARTNSKNLVIFMKFFCFRTNIAVSMMFIINVPAFMRYADSLIEFFFATLNQ